MPTEPLGLSHVLQPGTAHVTFFLAVAERERENNPARDICGFVEDMAVVGRDMEHGRCGRSGIGKVSNLS